MTSTGGSHDPPLLHVSDVPDDGELVVRLRSLLRAVARHNVMLPSEPSLAATLGASRPAVREALTRLEAEGLVSRRQGAATTINQRAHTIPARFDQQIEFMDVIAEAGHVAGLDVIEARVTELQHTSAEVLGVEPGTACWRTVKRWTADGEPVLVALDEIPLPAGNEERWASLDGRTSLFETVTQVTGDPVEWEIARPSAMIPPPDVSPWLDGSTDPALTLDLLGMSRVGANLYRAMEYHVPGLVDFGFVRTIR